MSIIGSTVPHFVRCIKPNMDKRDGLFDWNIAERQITTGGVVDAVAIVQQGFPYRRPCSEFAERYSHLVPSLRSADYAALKQQKLGSTAAAASGEYVSSSFKKRVSIAGDSGISQASGAARFVRMPDVQRCSLILQHLGVSQDRFAVGKSLLFLKAGVIGLLEDESARQRYYYATLLSKNATRFIVLRRYKAARRALLLLQCAWRCSRSRNLLHRKRTLVAQLLQKHIRCCLCRVPFVRNHAARTLGAACHQRLCRVPYVRNRVACTLHAACRSALVGRSYRAQLNQIYHKAKVHSLHCVTEINDLTCHSSTGSTLHHHHHIPTLLHPHRQGSLAAPRRLTLLPSLVHLFFACCSAFATLARFKFD
jgi:myosin heavy subunit